MPDLSLSARFLRLMLRHEIPGHLRLVQALAPRLKSLQRVPIAFADRPSVFVDLRSGSGWQWLQGSPWKTVPVEDDEQQLIRRIIKKTDVVYDIGANIGLYTSLFSRLAQRVVAFEPNPQLLQTLQVTTAALGNVTLSSVALSDKHGSATLFVPNDHTMASLADYTRAEELTDWKQQIGLTPAEVMQCATATLDSLIEGGYPHPDFIKCDVEGAELLVFRGARHTLAGPNAPLILFEVLEMCSNGFGIEKLAAADFLQDLGYALFDVGPGGSLKPMTPSVQRVNVLAVPIKKVSDLAH